MLFDILMMAVLVFCIITLVMCIVVLKKISETMQNIENKRENIRKKLNIIKQKKTNKKAMDDLERVKTLFENIDTFDGTAKGQQEIKNG